MENSFLIRREHVPLRILKIIPHRSVLNSNTRKFMHSLHQLLSVKHLDFPWEHKEGFFLKLRNKPCYWWITRISAENIEFIIALPEDLIESFKIKLNNFEQWSSCSLEDLGELTLPTENVDLYRLTYTRNDIFSLKFDYKEQMTPISDFMKLSHELNGEEEIFFMLRAEHFNREKWKRIADYAWSKWKRGELVPRRGIDMSRSLRSLFMILLQVLEEIVGLVRDTVFAIEKTFMAPNASAGGSSSNDKVTFQNPEIMAILAAGGPTARTKSKLSLPVFKTQWYLGVHSNNRIRREVLFRSARNAIETLNGDNSIKPIKINIRAKKTLVGLNRLEISDAEYNLMSTDELGKINQLPTRDLQMEFKDRLNYNGKIEVELPDVFVDSNGILAGTTTVKGKEIPVYIPVRDTDMLFTPRSIIGSPRMGKDQLAINMIVEANRKHGIGAIVPDVVDERNGHRGMADALRDHIPPENVIDINLGDFDYPPYLGLQTLAGEDTNDRILSNRIAQELTRFLMGDDMDNHQTKEYLQEFSKAVRGDVLGIKLLCLSDAYRVQIINDLKQRKMDSTALERFHSLSEGRQQQIAQPILIRLQQILGDEFLKPIFGQAANNKVNLLKWMREGKVVILRIPSRDLGEEAVKTIVYWIVLVAFLTRLKMNVNEDKGVFLVMNEPHQFMSKGLAHLCKRILSEGPKYRFSPIILFHNLSQIEDKSFVQILLSSSLNWHIFKNSNIKAYNELQNYIQPTFTPEEALSETKRFHYIACWLDDNGEYQTPFMVKAPDLVGSRYKSFDNSMVSYKQRRLYGRPIEEIIEEIREREKIIYAEALE